MATLQLFSSSVLTILHLEVLQILTGINEETWVLLDMPVSVADWTFSQLGYKQKQT